MQARKRSGFPGGIHPTDGGDKELSGNQPIIEYQPHKVKISMKQSPFGSCREVVARGDKVAVGQLIGIPESPLAVNVHTGIRGTVTDVLDMETGGENIRVCVIEGQAADAPVRPDYKERFRALPVISQEEAVDILRDKGICGMGGAGFPAHIKYQTDSPVHTLLINGAECEPYLTCDDRLMREEPYAVLCGMSLLKNAAGADQAILCIEENKKEAIAQFQEILEGNTQGILIRRLPVKYPQGGERQLIQAVLGLEVPYGGLTTDVGVLVSNVATAAACADAILYGTALTHRIVTVSGKVARPANYRVPIGCPLEELLELSGGVTTEENVLVLGGPMTGKKLISGYHKGVSLPGVTKTTSAALVLPREDYRESPCIRCGACGEVCPAGLIPFQIEYAYLENDIDWCDRLYAPACIGCGCCSYVCPARRPLARRVQESAGMIRRRKSERKE